LDFPSHDNFVPNFLGRSGQIQEGLNPFKADLEKLDQIFASSRLNYFSVFHNPEKYVFVVHSSRRTRKNLWSIPSAITTSVVSDDNEKSGKIIHFEKIGSNFFWTSLPSHDNFVLNFFGRKFGPAKFRKESRPHLEKLDQFFQNELFFRFP
jgi:hypothetical protein